jgi:hypothetical protein
MIVGTHGLIASQITQFVGLLDLYPNAAAAYSLRKLRSAYTGSAIRVRRTDLQESDIGFTSTGALDTTALLAFTGTGALDNGFVKTWYDQSGNGNNAIQTTAINQPQIVSAGSLISVNGKPTIYFNDKTKVCMDMTTTITTLNFTTLWVSKKDTTSADGSIILTRAIASNTYAGDDVDNSGNPFATSAGDIIATSKSNSSASGNEINQHLAYLNRRNSTEAVGQFNNSNNLYNNAVNSNNFVIVSIANYGFNYNFLGKLQEIIIYSSDKSSDRTGISNNINTHYAIY